MDKIKEYEIKEIVKDKLMEAVEIWAVDHLEGKPSLLMSAVYFALEKTLEEQGKKIREIFPD